MEVLLYIENRIPLKPVLGDVCSFKNHIAAYEETLAFLHTRRLLHDHAAIKIVRSLRPSKRFRDDCALVVQSWHLLEVCWALIRNKRDQWQSTEVAEISSGTNWDHCETERSLRDRWLCRELNIARATGSLRVNKWKVYGDIPSVFGKTFYDETS